MSNLNGPGYCTLLIAHCSLLILAHDSTPAGSWSQNAVNQPWRLSMNRRTRSAPGPRAQRVTRTGAMERFGPSAVGEALRAGTARAPVHGPNSRQIFEVFPFHEPTCHWQLGIF